MRFRFEELRVWGEALAYADLAYEIAERLPAVERYNLADQLRRAATSVALNIAEGSTSQSRADNARFVGYAVRSLIECVACHRLIQRRGYPVPPDTMAAAEERAAILFRRLQAFRHALARAPEGKGGQ